ncbi:MAG: uroporphyrinogen decarboxylase [Acetobacteraceae bacterium]|nr:uroporphyrinogen decarboxylase [Acetobacteraceae bacterium]MDW8399381.1 uroporphyrinogen decarboxylase [Acetobacteraceae bacterium]
MDARSKPLLRALSGEPVWPPPFWLMRQAGRYLPEYRRVRAEVPDFVALCTDPARAAEVTLQPLRRYGMDAAILFSDILMVPWALKRDLRFAEGEGPLLAPLRTMAEVEALDVGGVAAAAPVFETVARLAEALPREHPGAALIGFAGGCWTVACYMVEGRGGGEFAAARRMAHAEPGLFAALMERLEQATIRYLAAQAKAGAEALMIFDSWAGLLSPQGFRRWVIGPTARIRAALKELVPEVPVIGFPRLSGPLIAEYARETGVEAVAMDTGLDPAWARDAVPPWVALQGNLDPMALVAGGEGMMREVEAILGALRGRPFVFNLGHGVVPPTPPEHVAALAARLRQG